MGRKDKGVPEFERPRSDKDLGIHAGRAALLSQLEVTGSNKIHGSRYEPTPFGVLDDMLLGLEIDFERYTFVDLGAGKGRILCLASAWPWRAIVGVEFSRELAKIAEDHVRHFKAPWQRCTELRVAHRDVVEWSPPAGPLAFFLFNPFAAPVLAEFFAQFRSTGRELLVLYYMPVHQHFFANHPEFQWEAGSDDWVIYSSKPSQG